MGYAKVHHGSLHNLNLLLKGGSCTMGITCGLYLNGYKKEIIELEISIVRFETT
jgi:hypothetical protein